jgi:hypothetical protein
MSQQGLLKETVKILKINNIPYMITGSVVSSLQGIPRLTHDIDIVVILKKIDLKKILNAFPKEEYYFNESAILQAIEHKGQFNILHTKENGKIDFWILTDSSFDKSRFSRRQKVDFMGFKVIVSSPEDTVLEKLYWSKLSGGSRKQFEDALRVYELQYQKLDMDYLDAWSNELDITDLFKELKSKAEII